MTDENLFSDDEGPAELTETSTAVPPALEAGGVDAQLGYMVRRAIGHLTYRELHAFTVGFGPLFIGLVLGVEPLLLVAVGLTATAAGFCGVGPLTMCRHEKPAKAVQWAIKEPPYLLAGQLVALVLGAVTIALTTLLVYVAGAIA